MFNSKVQISKDTFKALYTNGFSLKRVDKTEQGEKGVYYSETLDCTMLRWICYATGIEEFYIQDINV